MELLNVRAKDGSRQFAALPRTASWRSSVGISRPSLGRVGTAAIAALQIPEESLAGNATFVRIAVIAGERMTLQGARHRAQRVTLSSACGAGS